jgi:hypothetical protein
MPWYRTEDGQGVMHLCVRGRQQSMAPRACRAPRFETDNPKVGAICGRLGDTLCDAPAGTDLAGKPLTCDMPICERHATHVAGRDLDYCPRHKHLAPGSLPFDNVKAVRV